MLRLGSDMVKGKRKPTMQNYEHERFSPYIWDKRECLIIRLSQEKRLVKVYNRLLTIY